MLKKTLYFSSPVCLSTKNKQIIIQLLNNTKTNKDVNLMQSEVITKPIEDIGIIILDNKQINLTTQLIELLLENNTAIIYCNQKGMPSGLVLPLESNNLQSERFRLQSECSQPLKKQLWQQIIKHKIENQAKILEINTSDKTDILNSWSKSVKSDDSDNFEARAAAYYWNHLFKKEISHFVRDRFGTFPNNLLNYGYAILRAIVARALIANGLLPTFGLHHHNRYNAYCLADDIMEPYRPYVDNLVFSMIQNKNSSTELTPNIKKQLLNIANIEVYINKQKTPLMTAVSITTASLCNCFMGKQKNLIYPTIKSHEQTKQI